MVVGTFTPNSYKNLEYIYARVPLLYNNSVQKACSQLACVCQYECMQAVYGLALGSVQFAVPSAQIMQYAYNYSTRGHVVHMRRTPIIEYHSVSISL